MWIFSPALPTVVSAVAFFHDHVPACSPVAVGNALIAMHEEMIQQMNFGLVHKFENETKAKITVETTVYGKDIQSKSISLNTVKCPECGTEIQMAEGCFICLNCGYSGCS